MNVYTYEEIKKTFELNSPDKTQIHATNDYIVIDNVFKNFDNLCDLVNSSVFTPFNITSTVVNDYTNKRSFFDYRGMVNISTVIDYNFLVQKLVHENFNIMCHESKIFNINVFKWKARITEKNYGEIPHQDNNAIVCISYFTNPGGTYLWEDIRGFDHGILPVDAGDYMTEDLLRYYKMKDYIESKLNRLLILKGNILHCGYMPEDDYIDRPRITGATFHDIKRIPK